VSPISDDGENTVFIARSSWQQQGYSVGVIRSLRNAASWSWRCANVRRSTRSRDEQGVHPNSLGRWKALYRVGKLSPVSAAAAPRTTGATSGTFVPVTITPVARVTGGLADTPSIVQSRCRAVPRCASRPARSTVPWSARSLRNYSNESRGDERAVGYAHLAGCRHDRYAQRLYRALRFGAGRACKQSVVRSSVRLSRPARRFDQALVVGWNRTLLDGEAIGTRSLHLAPSAEWGRCH